MVKKSRRNAILRFFSNSWIISKICCYKLMVYIKYSFNMYLKHISMGYSIEPPSTSSKTSSVSY